MRIRQKRTIQEVTDGLLRFAFGESLLHRYFRSGNSKTDVIATFDLVDVSHQSQVGVIHTGSQIGIVIQGPVIEGNTFNFCKFIQSTYPEVRIVLSTWVDEDVSRFKVLKKGNFQIIQSKKPEFPGPSNINMQIVSSRAGIEVLEDIGCSHILKTRTDIFLTNPQFLNYLTWAHSKGGKRAIVFSSFNSFLFRLYSLSDQVMFGNTPDIAKYWKIDLVDEETSIAIPEVFLFRKYINSLGYQPEENFESYLAALAEYAVIIDHEQLGQIWNKGTFTSLSYRWRGKNFPHPMSPLSYWLWDLSRKDISYFQRLREKLT